jgi:hypothetical protein
MIDGFGDRAGVDRVRVEVDREVDVHQLAAAVRRRVSGGSWPAGPERQVADAVVATVDRAGTAGGARRDDAVRNANRRVTRWH